MEVLLDDEASSQCVASGGGDGDDDPPQCLPRRRRRSQGRGRRRPPRCRARPPDKQVRVVVCLRAHKGEGRGGRVSACQRASVCACVSCSAAYHSSLGPRAVGNGVKVGESPDERESMSPVKLNGTLVVRDDVQVNHLTPVLVLGPRHNLRYRRKVGRGGEGGGR